MLLACSNHRLEARLYAFLQLKSHAFCFKLSFRFKPVLDIVALCLSSSKEQFVRPPCNVVFTDYAVMFCNNEVDVFCFSSCL
jgi:hypothetical protein